MNNTTGRDPGSLRWGGGEPGRRRRRLELASTPMAVRQEPGVWKSDVRCHRTSVSNVSLKPQGSWQEKA